jgi:hypothetical protein
MPFPVTEEFKMGRDERASLPSITGPNGIAITLADLPARDTKRWVSSRKAVVVLAVQGGLISLDDACTRYSLSVEEFLSWERAVERHGVPGLRITHAKHYRSDPEREREAA